MLRVNLHKVSEAFFKRKAIIKSKQLDCSVRRVKYNFVSDETRQISQLICAALADLDFVDDFDRKLKFLTDCRAKFKRLEIVQVIKKIMNELYLRSLTDFLK